MTFEELLALPVKKSDKDANCLMGHYYNHLGGEDTHGQGWYDEWQDVPRVDIHYLEDFCYDGRRTWTLAYLQLDGHTVMMFKNAGREGDDHSGAVIFDESRFRELKVYLNDLIDIHEEDVTMTSLLADAGSYESFYGDSIHTPFVYH